MVISKKYLHADAWPAATGAFACLVGIAVLIGWQFSVPFLKTPVPATAVMPPNAALCFILLGISLWQLRERGGGAGTALFGRACAAFVFLFSVLTLLEYTTGLNFGIDGLFYAHRLSDWTQGPHPGRVALDAAFAFMSLSLGLLLLDRKWKGPPVSEYFATAAGLVAFLQLIGYWYEVQYLYGHGAVLRMPIHGVITVLVLSSGVFFSRTGEGFAALLLGRDISGSIARSLFVTIVVVLTLLGCLHIKLAAAGIVRPEFGTVLLAGIGAAVFSVFTFDTARWLRYQNIEREHVKALRLLASIIESSDDSIYSENLDGIITSWNKGAERLYGYTADEAIGQSTTILQPPDRDQEMRNLLNRISRGERIEHHESVRMCKDGHLVDIFATFSPLKDSDGNITGISAIVPSIMERERAIEEIRQLNADLEHRVLQRTAELTASNKELEAFSYSVSHDLRAPLRHIDGFSKMLLERYHQQLDAKGRHYLEEVRLGTQNMGVLIDELLTLSRISRQEPQLQAGGLDSLFEDARIELMKDAGNRKIEWRIASLPFVKCDPVLMRQAIVNLLSNAVKYTGPRELAVIEVGQMQQGNETVVYVRDNGVGFNMKYADKLFGVFQRLHRSEDFEGSGVGLATVQRIITKHGGRVWAEAELNKGATFFFTLKVLQNNTVGQSVTATGGTHA